MSEWREVKIVDICNMMCSGGTPKSTNPEFYNGTIPWLNTKEVNFCKIYETKNYITQKGLESSSAKWVAENSIIIAMYGATAAKVAISKIPLTTNQACCNLCIDPLIADYQYVYYYLCYQYEKLFALANGGAQQNLSVRVIKEFKVCLPPLVHQKAIAAVLSALDDKIELNNRINKNLEAQAQAIFKSWFVDFEPFRDGEFVDSELGLIPKGWRVICFKEILSVRSEKTGNRTDAEYSVTNTGIHPRSKKFKKQLSASPTKNKLVLRGDLVFGMSRDILNWGIMKDDAGGVSSAYHVYSIDACVSTSYVEEFIDSHLWYFKDLIRPSAREGQGIDSGALANKIIFIPPNDELEKYNSIWEDLRKMMLSVDAQSQTLAALRDTLLPKLMSGEIRVPLEV